MGSAIRDASYAAMGQRRGELGLAVKTRFQSGRITVTRLIVRAEVNMKGHVRATILGITVATILAACASRGPANPGSIPAANANPSAPAASEIKKDLTAGDDHDLRRLVQNSGPARICRREPMTGSRVKMHEVCLTQAEIKAQREGSRTLIDNIRRSPAELPTLMPDGSVSKPLWTQ